MIALCSLPVVIAPSSRVGCLAGAYHAHRAEAAPRPGGDDPRSPQGGRAHPRAPRPLPGRTGAAEWRSRTRGSFDMSGRGGGPRATPDDTPLTATTTASEASGGTRTPGSPADIAFGGRAIAHAVAIAAVYFAAAKLGLSMAFVAEQVTAVWPPTGIALALVVVLGPAVWPGIALGA